MRLKGSRKSILGLVAEFCKEFKGVVLFDFMLKFYVSMLLLCLILCLLLLNYYAEIFMQVPCLISQFMWS